MNQFFSNNKKLNNQKTNHQKFNLKIWLGLAFILLIVFSPEILWAKENNRVVVFQEARQWQIASDASADLTLRPNAAGAETTWAVTGTTSNYQAVNSETPSETVYVEQTTTNYTNDLYALPNPDRTAKGTINSVTVYINHRRMETGKAGENAPILRTNSTVYIGTSYTRDTYILDSHAWSQNPNNSSAWTWDDIDALQIGIRYVDGHNLQTGVRCNQSYVVVNYEIVESPGPPGTPTYTSISTSTLTVNWTAPSTGGLADYYELERALDVGGSPGAFSQIATTTATTSNDSGLSSGTFYWYQVRAVNLAGAGDYSASSSVLTLSGPPGMPTYSNISTSTLRVSWTVPSGETPDYYELERAPDDGGSPGVFSQTGTTSSLYYDDSGLEGNTTYWYQVRAVNQSGAGTYSDYSDVTTLDAPPGPPSTPTYDNVSTSTLKVQWTMGEGGTPAYYKIERAPDVGGTPGVFSQIATTTEIFYNDSGLAQGTAYWYQVRAWNALGDSNYSDYSSVKTFPDIPGTPTYSNIATTTLQVNWTASAGGTPDYYKIERAPDVSGSPGSFSQIATTTNIFYNDSGLDSLVKYWYRIRATNITGDSEYSGYSDVTTLDAPPGTPGTPTYSNVTGSTLRVNWTAPTEGGEVYYYELERADDNSGSPGVFSQIATTTNLYFNDSGLQGVTIYWYQVQAINDLGESGFSTASFVSTASATILKGNIRIKGGTIIK